LATVIEDFYVPEGEPSVIIGIRRTQGTSAGRIKVDMQGAA